MSKLDEVTLIPRALKADERGWFLKVVEGKEEHLSPTVGEVYLTMAVPGQVRGNHYHHEANEWMTVVMGKSQLVISDPTTGETRELLLDAASPVTVFMPAGVAHAFKNADDAEETMLLVAYSDVLYDPADTVPLKLL